MAWILLVIAVIAEVVATSGLKLSEGFTRPVPSLVVVVGYAIAFYLLSLVVRQLPVGVVYAIWSGLGVVLVSVVGWVAFDQKLDLPAMIGMALILSGVFILNLYSSGSAH